MKNVIFIFIVLSIILAPYEVEIVSKYGGSYYEAPLTPIQKPPSISKFKERIKHKSHNCEKIDMTDTESVMACVAFLSLFIFIVYDINRR